MTNERRLDERQVDEHPVTAALEYVREEMDTRVDALAEPEGAWPTGAFVAENDLSSDMWLMLRALMAPGTVSPREALRQLYEISLLFGSASVYIPAHGSMLRSITKRAVVDMHQRGYTEKEIVDRLGMARSDVTGIIRYADK